MVRKSGNFWRKMVEMIIINSYLLKLCFISLFINGKFFKIVFVLIVRVK